MRVELVTMWYNEEFLAPFFLNHYSWVDKIHIILDAETSDNTMEIIKKYPNTIIYNYKFPDKLDDSIKAKLFTDYYRLATDADYFIAVDSDEFIFCNEINKPVKQFLQETNRNVYFVNLWQIYKHIKDLPLDPSIPIPLQRRHGDPDLHSDKNHLYMKPCVVKTGQNLNICIGQHYLCYEDGTIIYTRNVDIDSMRKKNVSIDMIDRLQGSHWKLVDLEERINRILNNRKNRLSAVNISCKWGDQYEITKEDIIAEYEQHKNDPIVIYNRIA